MLLLDGMELQLGLALPSNPMKGFDLNSCYVYEPKGALGSDIFNHLGSNEGTSKLRKRGLTQAFDEQDIPQTLPLLAWNNHPNEEDDGKQQRNKPFIIHKYDIGDEDGVVGWPPINSWRKKLCNQNHGGQAADINGMVDNGGGRGGGGGGGGRGSNSMYVKVKMEGVAIARKVDLSRHESYETLTDTLVDMFWIRQEDVKAYTLTYQDKEGDWLLVGDVPWQTFIQSVQRLKLLRTRG
ncbi:auxin-responsive protein IAA29-like [Cornus florida]|uniref:auxin-responsive protein IAA29-like n=1 Tax=Cornus florida TaxID=4283 RepID=UPI00289EEC5C|nr:auxin-responsive protein IAA29-like [Cornus florida]